MTVDDKVVSSNKWAIKQNACRQQGNNLVPQCDILFRFTVIPTKTGTAYINPLFKNPLQINSFMLYFITVAFSTDEFTDKL